ncbi:hypothetical protein M408DRAFT_29497 [Serendipita vermifera MAFF 305830]|uniref:Endonuclease/exonuclease/phosphatase domain-containing protein n=1 Tax=Serendipita vermifera MAFF 305830 TaxID=933852 RepID=A0A0C2W502_SERVB|nr:hypothetical protein M408DRAFT_29497 [Serendipita vermifera MAFF 305830]
MPSKGTFQLSEEQLALQAARKALKEKKALGSSGQTTPTSVENSILQRQWLLRRQISSETRQIDDRLSVMTWNMLAQSLVRRELFPGSDALKFAQRGPMLSCEILTYDTDVLCLQEVDRLDVLLPAIQHRYSHVYAAGRKKQHGCMVLFKTELFDLHSSQTIYYDEEDVRQGEIEDESKVDLWRRGTSRITKNIALIVALKRKGSDDGVVVATTHLFWHPAYVYERAKQVGILLRSVSSFRKQNNLEKWPCFIAGDLNLTPDDVAYSLIVGESITPQQQHIYDYSRVVHVTIDPTIPKMPTYQIHLEQNDDEEGGGAGGEEEENDPDRVIVNSRACIPSDGLLDLEELKDLYRESGMTPMRSLYDEFLRTLEDEGVETMKTRLKALEGRKGGDEPAYTSYTRFWKSTLDYIFLLPPGDRTAEVESILRPHKTEDLGTGIPKKGVCGSDHISLGVRVAFQT